MDLSKADTRNQSPPLAQTGLRPFGPCGPLTQEDMIDGGYSVDLTGAEDDDEAEQYGEDDTLPTQAQNTGLTVKSNAAGDPSNGASRGPMNAQPRVVDTHEKEGNR